jgi:2-oxoglutarate/2-oxoacid ferredoxin oxidoreductase subunit alpha
MAVKETDIQIAVCGSAGDGAISAGSILKHAMANAGYRVIAFDTYPAEIRGFGKCIARVRITSEQVYSLKAQSDVLISLNDGHAIAHVAEVRNFGCVIYESEPITDLAEGEHISGHVRPGHIPYGLPVRGLSERATGTNRSRNMVVLGFLAGHYKMPFDVFHEAITSNFGTKGKTIIENSIAAFDAGVEEARESYRFDLVKLNDPPPRKVHEVAILTGNEAVVRGCLDAGIDMYFGYPITPATTIMEGMATELPKRGKRMLQTEDEIAAISATLGASYAGVRAATATSGPGLALMAEMLGLGVMAEVPAVVFVSQRGGPSTGMPTKTEQSDLNLAIYGGAGDAQRIVLAPTSVEGCYYCAGKAFELAERFQTPVIVLLDLYLSNRFESVVFSEDRRFNLDAGKRLQKRGTQRYRRFEITKTGISPRAVPGQAGGLYTATGLEHDEYGHPSYEPEVHSRMSEKRHDKLLGALKHRGLTHYKRLGDKGHIDVGLLAWGSTYGEVLEAMQLARKEGIRCAAMKVVMLSPLPVEPINDFFNDCAEVLIPELNYEGQFANMVSGALGRSVHRLNRVTGSPMQVSEILDAIRELVTRQERGVA